LTSQTSLAPILISKEGVKEFLEVTGPEQQKTSRPCSPANLAVIKEPDLSAPSVTNVPNDIPEIILLRAGKLPLETLNPGGYSETTTPPLLIISFTKPSFLLDKLHLNYKVEQQSSFHYFLR